MAKALHFVSRKMRKLRGKNRNKKIKHFCEQIRNEKECNIFAKIHQKKTKYKFVKIFALLTFAKKNFAAFFICEILLRFRIFRFIHFRENVGERRTKIFAFFCEKFCSLQILIGMERLEQHAFYWWRFETNVMDQR